MKIVILLVLILIVFISACQTQQELPSQTEQSLVQEPTTPTPAVEQSPAPPQELIKEQTLPTPPKKQEEFKLIQPTLTYEGAYNGPLYDTSLQIGSEGDIDIYFNTFDKNGLNFFIGYFKIDYPPNKDALLSTRQFGYLLEGVQKHPERIIPYISLSIPADKVYTILGSAMTTRYKTNLETVQRLAGKDLVKGFGEIEAMDYTGYHVDSPELIQIYDLAQEKNVNVMFHPGQGEASRVETLLKKYPEQTFLIHMYREDIVKDRQSYIRLLQTYNNLYFSVDVDHMMHDGDTGLLYKYQDKTIPTAVSSFVMDYTKLEKPLLEGALEDYTPLINAAPTKVMWGTEMGPKYNFEPAVYDRMIKFSRLFIGKLDPTFQEGFAYKNALTVFGKGATLETSLPLIDASNWPECNEAIIDQCDEEARVCGPIESPEEEQCLDICMNKNKCLIPLED